MAEEQHHSGCGCLLRSLHFQKNERAQVEITSQKISITVTGSGGKGVALTISGGDSSIIEAEDRWLFKHYTIRRRHHIVVNPYHIPIIHHQRRRRDNPTFSSFN